MPQDGDRERPCAQREAQGRSTPCPVDEWTGQWDSGAHRQCGAHESRDTVPRESDFFHFLPCSPDDSSPADIFAVGFEEMVELSAGNIVNAR